MSTHQIIHNEETFQLRERLHIACEEREAYRWSLLCMAAAMICALAVIIILGADLSRLWFGVATTSTAIWMLAAAGFYLTPIIQRANRQAEAESEDN